LPLLGRAYADCGDALRAEQAYLKLQAMTESEYVVWWNLAIVAAGTGRLDDALTHLELALENREPALLFLKSLPWFTPIAESSRFKEILRIVGP
jgi:tetratricopeptide (TPR) repeat protein